MPKIITWNVNSVKARLPNVLEYLRETKPDIALLQELKCVDEAFPFMEIEELGYACAVHGQKTYNGVAILSKYPLEDVYKGFDEQARYIEAVANIGTQAIRVASVYVPNGQSPDSDKFTYKLSFYDTLKERIETLLTYDEKLVIGGDYNVSPEAVDVYDVRAMEGHICYHPSERQKFRELMHLGLTDAFRAHHPDMKKFSWWDYRAGCFEHDKGLRIDHLLLSPQAADACISSHIDSAPRAKEKASDHTPVWCEVG